MLEGVEDVAVVLELVLLVGLGVIVVPGFVLITDVDTGVVVNGSGVTLSVVGWSGVVAVGLWVTTGVVVIPVVELF